MPKTNISASIVMMHVQVDTYVETAFEFAVTAQSDDDHLVNAQADQVKGFSVPSFFFFVHCSDLNATRSMP